MSKNQLKKLKRDQQWEENRAKRKAIRKEKVQEKKKRKRETRAEASPANLNPNPSRGPEHTDQTMKTTISQKRKRAQFEQLPLTIILDCGFDDLMMDKERKSLASQVTRCYSDNHKAPYQSHLAISSFGGHLKERFDGLLAGNHQSWKNVCFLEGDFVDAAAQAKSWMQGDCGGKLKGVFANKDDSAQALAGASENGEVVYLTSDSPDTLTELRPYSTYIIGGLVDRNRHKGICYKRARDRGMKTAKLPIGDYMQMTSRFVLATNHVAEIMLRWLEVGDWGKAFLQVVPKRKGGVLKDHLDKAAEGDLTEYADGEVEDVDGRPDVEAIEPVSIEQATSGRDSGTQTGEISSERAEVAKQIAEAEGSNLAAGEGKADYSSNSEDGGVQLRQP